MTTSLTIQQAAAATGLTVHTLRYYERIGLIDPIPRQDNKHRLYREEDILWIEFLLKLRATGLPVRHMLRYAELRRQGNHQESVSERKAMLQKHTLSLEVALSELQGNLDVMRKKVALYARIEASLKDDADPSSISSKEHLHDLSTKPAIKNSTTRR
jgi:DNA-binding transcriptional MerR regulator